LDCQNSFFDVLDINYTSKVDLKVL
jgi:hypothetical protein